MTTPNKSELLQEMMQGKRPAFFLICQGRVQIYDHRNGRGMIVSPTLQALKALAKCYKGKQISVAEAGTVEGETLATQVATSTVEHGASGVFLTEDGVTMNFLSAPTKGGTTP